VLGAAGVKAQVRIGGNTAPSKAAVLDLNPTDATNAGTGGLVLPRVNLTSNTMQLTNGVANVTGTMVYDVTTTLGRIGVYFWNGNSWVLASLPPATAGDSGKVLVMSANGPYWGYPNDLKNVVVTTSMPTPAGITWSSYTLVVDVPAVPANGTIQINCSGISPNDMCTHLYGFDWGWWETRIDALVYVAIRPQSATTGAKVRCFRPS